MVDTTETVIHPGGTGHPLEYLDQVTITQHGEKDAQRIVGEYEPAEEFVSVLLRPQDRQSTYRAWVVSAAAGGDFK